MNLPPPRVDPLVKAAVRVSLAAITHARTTLEQLGDLARVHPRLDLVARRAILAP